MEKLRVGKPNDIALIELHSSGEEDILKSRRHDEDRRLKERYAGHRLDP